MGISIAIVTLNIALSFSQMGVYNIYHVIENIGSDLSMLLASITLFVSYRFEKYVKLNKIITLNKSEINTEREAVQGETQSISNIESSKLNTANTENIISSQLTSEMVIEELKKYKELVNNGVITQEEFEAKKKQLLDI